MTMTQLVYFVAVAEELNITRIAEQFHVSQPAVSSAIRDLEKEFRVSLFERHHNDLFLTSTGNIAYQQAKRLVEHYEEFRTSIEKLQMDKSPLQSLRMLQPFICRNCFPICRSSFRV